ncbi:nucleoside hydrolase [Rhodococcus sp. C26F]
MRVPLDITNNHSPSRADVDLLQTASTDPAVQLAATMLAYYLDRNPEFDHSKCLWHDPLAAAIALGSVSLNESPSCTISVETDGEHRGRTLVTFDEDASSDTSASRHRIALSATADFGPLLMSALLPNAQTLRSLTHRSSLCPVAHNERRPGHRQGPHCTDTTRKPTKALAGSDESRQLGHRSPHHRPALTYDVETAFLSRRPRLTEPRSRCET